MRSHGFTVVEALVAVALFGLVIGALQALWSVGHRMNTAASGSVLLQSAMTIEETMIRDVRELGIDPNLRDMLLINAKALSFYKVVFSGEDIRLCPVKYERVEKRPGLFYLRRSELTPDGKLTECTYTQAPLGALVFMLIDDRRFGNRYLRVDFTVMDSERVRSPGAYDPDHSSSHSLVLRIPVPSNLSDPKLRPATRIVPDRALLSL
jgi:hypothetical protein